MGREAACFGRAEFESLAFLEPLPVSQYETFAF
jgi:hypothetical protein